MLEHIGEQIRASVLAGLSWASRSAGYTEPVQAVDGETRRLFPGSKPIGVVNCEAGQYINLGPDNGQTGIVFVDSISSMVVKKGRAKYSEIEVPFRVVVWYDERKISVPSGNVMLNIQSDIVLGIKSVTLDTDGLVLTKVVFSGFEHDPAKVWGRYGIAINDVGMFIAPYSTFAINFKMIGRLIPSCFTQTITVNESAC